MNELISSPFALCVCFERRSEVHKPPCALRSLSPLCHFNSQTIERAVVNDNDSIPKYEQAWRSKKKALCKETTAIPAQICSVWRRLAFHIDTGGLSTVPPTLLRPLIGRIERARRQNCGDGRSSRGTLKYGAKAVWVKRGQIRSSKGVTRKVLTVGNT